MALVAAKIQKDLESAIFSALKMQFATETAADASSHQKMAAAIAQGVATVIVTALQSDAQVLPGIATAGSPAAQTSVSPGQIF